MSATMAYGYDRPRMISGVCAEIAARAALPAWIPRVAFVIGGMTHAIFAIFLYVVLARVLCLSRRATRAPGRAGSRHVAASYAGPDLGMVRDRFGNLDQRLSDLEAASLQRETALRRAFRDLERQ